MLIFVEIETDEGVTGLGGPVDRGTASHLHVALPQFADRHGSAGDRAHLGHHVPRGRARPQRHPDVRHQRHRLRPLGPARQGRWASRCTCCSAVPPAPSSPAYATMLGFSLEPDKVEARAKEYAAKGYTAQNGSPRWGPSDGREGIRKNVALMETLRAVGRTGKRHHDRRLDVVGCAVHPRYGPAAQTVRSRAGSRSRCCPTRSSNTPRSATNRWCPISGGEHEYTRWGIKELLDAARGRPHASRHLLGRRHQRDAENLRPLRSPTTSRSSRTATRCRPMSSSAPRFPRLKCPTSNSWSSGIRSCSSSSKTRSSRRTAS